MYSPHIPLKEFVASIPVCQENASLETMLNAFQLSKSGAIAVVNQRQFPLGIIPGERLLKFLSRELQNQATVAVGLRKQLHHTVGLSATTELDFLIESVTIFSSQMQLEEFLPHLQNTINTDRQIPKYLVIDAQKRLLGLLNTQEILVSLVFDSQQLAPMYQPSTFDKLRCNSIEPVDLSSILQAENAQVLEASGSEEKSFNSQRQSDLTPTTKQQQISANNQKLIRLNCLQDELWANISHELKSPLTGIVGLSSLLQEQKLGSLNERQLHYAQLIYRNGRKLMGIVSDLLDLTNLATGKLKLNLEPVEIENLCRQTYEQVLTKLASKVKLAAHQTQDYSNRSFQLTIEPNLNQAIADRLRLNQILACLLENIFEHSQSQEQVGIDVITRKNWIAFTIWHKENCTGAKSVEMLSSASVNSNIAGILNQGETDLSLAIAQELAALHGGDISYITKMNQGREFTLLLPVGNLLTQKSCNLEHFTILCLYPEPELSNLSTNPTSNLEFNLKDWAERYWTNEHNKDGLQNNYHCRIIEADGLEQADMLARIWQLNAIVLDGHLLKNPLEYLRSLQQLEHLTNLPLIVLDAKTSAAASQVSSLHVYPCLVPAECRSIADLMQVIQIATEK